MTDVNPLPLTRDGRFKLLVDAITDYAIYMLDPDGRIRSWNSGAQRLKGYSESEVLGEHFSKFYTAEDRDAGLPAGLLSISASTGKFEGEGWRVRKGGEQFWAHIVIDPILSPDGELLGFAKITRDLTERRLAQEALRKSEEQFRILVQGVTDYSIYMIDPDGVIASWNMGAQRIKGYLPEDIIGQHFSTFYTNEDRARGEPARALAIAAREGRFEKEGWRVRKDGSTFWAHVIIDAIHEDGKLIGFAKVTRDITERRAAQRALEEAQEHLRQSQKMEAIGQLTGGIAHDFNNLLMVIMSSLELLQRRLPAGFTSADLLDNALEAAKRGASLTHRMLAFARRQELKAEPNDVAELVHGMSALLKRSIGPAIEIETRFPLGLPRARVDANHLELALLNLVVNARDAMPDGGLITIAARLEAVGGEKRADQPPEIPPGQYINLSITDTGVGMNDDVLARASEPFFTTKGLGKGTGLGLAMVHGFAAQSGGSFLLRSKLDAGTTAEIWLPVASVEAEQQVEEPRAGSVDSPPRRLRVLAVDDDSLVLFSTVEMLKEIGHDVRHASSGARALALLAEDATFDVLVTDQAMPGMTGIELIEEARRASPSIAAILASGYAELPGVTDVPFVKLSKPFTERALAVALSSVVSDTSASS